MKGKSNILFYSSLFLYIIFLIWVILLKFNDTLSLEENYYILKDLSSIDRIITSIIPFKNLDLRDFILNIILFIPFGLILMFINNEFKYYQITIIGFEVSLIFEVIQLITLLGGFSINDILANTLGALLGYFSFLLIFSKEKRNSQLVVNTFLIAFLVPFIYVAIVSFIKNFNFYLSVVTKTL